jgi:nicotinamide-nucleotide adenylyltransferase
LAKPYSFMYRHNHYSLMRSLLIGRFQPFHKGHLKLIHYFLKKNHEIIIGIGSAEKSYTERNPFTGGERYLMISQSLEKNHCHIIPIPDINRYGVWVSHVTDLVPPFDEVLTNNPLLKELFTREGYTVQETPLFKRKEYSGTEIRKRMLKNKDWQSLVPPSVVEIIAIINGIQRIKHLSSNDK